MLHGHAKRFWAHWSTSYLPWWVHMGSEHGRLNWWYREQGLTPYWQAAAAPALPASRDRTRQHRYGGRPAAHRLSYAGASTLVRATVTTTTSQASALLTLHPQDALFTEHHTAQAPTQRMHTLCRPSSFQRQQPPCSPPPVASMGQSCHAVPHRLPAVPNSPHTGMQGGQLPTFHAMPWNAYPCTTSS